MKFSRYYRESMTNQENPPRHHHWLLLVLQNPQEILVRKKKEIVEVNIKKNIHIYICIKYVDLLAPLAQFIRQICFYTITFIFQYSKRLQKEK